MQNPHDNPKIFQNLLLHTTLKLCYSGLSLKLFRSKIFKELFSAVVVAKLFSSSSSSKRPSKLSYKLQIQLSSSSSSSQFEQEQEEDEEPYLAAASESLRLLYKEMNPEAPVRKFKKHPNTIRTFGFIVSLDSCQLGHVW